MAQKKCRKTGAAKAKLHYHLWFSVGCGHRDQLLYIVNCVCVCVSYAISAMCPTGMNMRVVGCVTTSTECK